MSVANLERHFTPQQPKPDPEKPKISDRLSGLIGRVSDKFRTRQQQQAANFRELVDQLAAAEIGGKGKLAPADEIAAILEADNRTADDLATAVERIATIHRKRDELKGEADAIDALEETRDIIKREQVEFDQIVAKFQSRQDQLAAEREQRASRVEYFKSIRAGLRAMAGDPSSRENEIGEEIRECIQKEMELRSRAGRSALPDKYIEKSVKEFAEFSELQAAEEELAQLDKEISGLTTHPGTSWQEQHRPKVSRRVEDLRVQVQKTSRSCELGAEVRAVRERQRELAAERDRLAADRLHQIEHGEVAVR